MLVQATRRPSPRSISSSRRTSIGKCLLPQLGGYGIVARHASVAPTRPGLFPPRSAALKDNRLPAGISVDLPSLVHFLPLLIVHDNAVGWLSRVRTKLSEQFGASSQCSSGDKVVSLTAR